MQRAWLVLGMLGIGGIGCWGCAYPYTVRNVGQGETALYASVGGPLFDNFGAPVPVPAVVVGAQHGVTDFWDVHGSLHLLAAFYTLRGDVLRPRLRRAGLRLQGFGRSQGSPTEAGVYEDAEAALAFLLGRPGVDPARVVFVGDSLGAAVCTEIAYRHADQPAVLVLEEPFRSADRRLSPRTPRPRLEP